MYLSNIELVGFKSFATKTKLDFNSGVSAIVGPNGCGKSNIVDAMRWVLGEKKASSLRSEMMGDVIFNGSKDRKPLSMAEVTLIIDNDKKILPIEYDQISVTRRLFRSGESEYLLNKTKCRAKDIHDLFMDTGIGPDTYSVIELKMVESILSGRVDERRKLFEEAAGIKKYKQRKKETQAKLDHVRDDMERLGDIIEEVRKNVNSLSRQASKTKRYNTLRKELENLELQLFAHEYKGLSESKSNKVTIYNMNLTEKNKIQTKHDEYNRTIDELKQELTQVEEKYEEALVEENKLASHIAEKKQSIAVFQEKISSYEKTFNRLKKEIEDGTYNKEKIGIELTYAEEQLTKLKLSIDKSEESFISTKIRRDESARKTAKLKDEVLKVNGEIFTNKNKIESLKDISKRLETRKQSIKTSLEKIAIQESESNNNLQRLEENKLSLEYQHNELSLILEESKDNFKRAEEEKKILENNIINLNETLDRLRNELSARKASLIFLEKLETGSESEKFLANSKWLENKEKLLLGEITDTDEMFKQAVSIALGELEQSYIIDNDDEAFSAIELLKKENKGKSGFIKINKKSEINEQQNFKSIKGCYGLVSDLLIADIKIKNIVAELCHATVIVDNRDTAQIVINSGADKAITLDGEIFYKSLYIRGGSANKNQGIAIGRKIKIKNIKKEIDDLNIKIHDTEKHIADEKETIILLDFPELENRIRIQEREYNSLTTKITRLELEQESVERNNQMVENNKHSYIVEIEKIEEEVLVNDHQIGIINPEIEKLEIDYENLYKKLITSEEELNLCEEELKSAEISKIRIISELEQVKLNINRNKNEISHIDSQNIRRQEEIHTFTTAKTALSEDINKFQNELDIEEKRIIEHQYNKEFAKEERKMLTEQVEQNSLSRSQIQKELNKLNEIVHNLDIEINELKVHLNYITSRAKENYQIDLIDFDFSFQEEFSIESAKKQVEEIKNNLNLLGNINFQALEEFEIHKDRLDFSENQMHDLMESEKILKETIEEINIEAENRFKTTFEAVRINFKSLFKKLFGAEGDADLTLTTEDLLESDIDISAQPPGKRPHSIEMLSGGEKTLTAIALLFGIYLVKPSPFCILDEVDAPLDDKNIDKYISLIKDFSDNTQFLLVTHNKKTMSAASTLYGITMQEQGVSKVVSVNIETMA